jgi:serine/threonine-protein kinase
VPAELEERLRELAELAEPAGRGVRWLVKVRRPSTDRRSPSRRRSPHDYMTGWCNGSAGYVHLWTLAHAVLGVDAYLTLAERAAWNAWEDRDPLGTLCCGLVGRAYALLNLSRYADERTWLDRAAALAQGIEAEAGRGEDHRHSLYKGEMGAAVLAADLSRPEEASLPLFEPEGWPSRILPG